MTTVLLTGFEPFAGDVTNPSGDAVRMVADQWDEPEKLVTAVLPVEFDRARRSLLELIAMHEPDVVIATGLAGGRTGISVERVAINLIDARIPDNAGDQPVDVPSSPGAPAAHFATLPVKAITAAIADAGIPAAVSHSAGTFVCNHAMFTALDVVYNHTAEEGFGGPRTSLRGIDNRSYYRQTDEGVYIDETGCGNAVDTSTDAAARLVLDSLRYWANDVQIDGFRFDLAVTLGRDEKHAFTPDHPLLRAIHDDPALSGVKKIAEPWDVGIGGWQTGNFGGEWLEWNDRYRDRVRNFWLSDIDYARRADTAPVGVGGFATRLAGSSNTFAEDRGPLASVNFVTAHDGFTLRDLVSYDVKHNLGNGEHNRDGADTNRSFNHGAEGATDDSRVLATRRRAMRNLMGTLLLSAGVPMITAGDEVGRTQRGNNNAYCHDSALTWLSWDHAPWQRDLFAHTQRLLRLRRENPALRPTRFARDGERIPSATVMQWYDEHGATMSSERWTDPAHRTLQWVATSTPETEAPNRVLLVIHGDEREQEVTLPELPGATVFVSLWSSDDETPSDDTPRFAPGDVLPFGGTTMRLFRVE